MTATGIMQGRLSPAPAGRAQQFPDQWAGEFTRARSLGLESIEWLVTAESLDRNPILSPQGLGDVRRAIAQSRVPVRSLCADCFIARPLRGAPDPRSGHDLLHHLMAATRDAGGDVLVLPFLEGNALRSAADAAEALSLIVSALDRASAAQITVAIESDWPADRLRQLLDDHPHAALGVCYDTGNAAAAGFDPASELRTLRGYVAEVHVKDRRRGGGSVPLGDGDVDFDAVAVALDEIGFAGPLIMETPAGEDPLASAAANLAFLRARALGRHVLG